MEDEQSARYGPIVEGGHVDMSAGWNSGASVLGTGVWAIKGEN